MGLPEELYAEILDRARSQRKIASIDAAGAVLRIGLLARPAFMKPNRDEFFQLLNSSSVSIIPPHTALTFGKAGVALIHEGRYIHAQPPRIYDTNPIGAGDSFVAGYLKHLLLRAPAPDCLRFAMAAAASDASTLRPGFVDISQVRSLAGRVELRFLPSSV